MIVARYDRELAARLLRPTLDQLDAIRSSSAQDFVSWRILAALATIDPKEAVERIEKLTADATPGIDSNSPRKWAITLTARLLARQGKERLSLIYEHLLYLWTPDQRHL
jgi:hypothetical protein